MPLYSWHAGSSERSWAIAIVIVCCMSLIILLLWPDSQQPIIPKPDKPSKIKVAITQPISPTPPFTVGKIKPLNAPTTTKKKTSRVTLKGYFIQVGAFHEKKRAQTLKKKLIRKQWPVIIAEKKQLYAVQIGPYHKQSTANSVKKKLAKTEKLNGFITHY